ncbi:MAG TPA: hypothetical protein DHV28_09730 [Ignavibacteriales bacterium]|nr:hypothetical protein [Ignavibacteriales bacterium]
MKKNRIFYFFSIIPIVFFFGILFLYVSKNIDPDNFFSLFYGFIFSSINFFTGVLAIQFGFEKTDKMFLIIVFGGLVARFVLMFVLIVIALKFLFVRPNSFIFTTFIFYFYYLIVEIYILTQKKNIIIKTNND